MYVTFVYLCVQIAIAIYFDTHYYYVMVSVHGNGCVLDGPYVDLAATDELCGATYDLVAYCFTP